MGKWIFVFLFSLCGLVQISFAQKIACNKTRGEVTCVGTVDGILRSYTCTNNQTTDACAKQFSKSFPSKQTSNQTSSGGGTSSDYSAANTAIGQGSQMAGMAMNMQNAGQNNSAEFGSAYQQDQVKAGHGVNSNNAGGTSAATAGGTTKDPQAAADQYFQETDIAMNGCENSWHSLFTNNCSTTGSTILNGMSSVGSGNAGSGMNANANTAQATGATASAGLSGAKGACNASLFSCKSTCTSVKEQAAKDLSTCQTTGATNHANTVCGNAGSNEQVLTCIEIQEAAFIEKCELTAKKYVGGAASSVKKCYAAGAAFLAVIAGGIIAINKYKKNAKALKNEVEYTDEPNTEAVGSATQQEELIWNNGRHEVVSSSKSNSTNTASGTTVSLGASGSTNSAQSNSRKIADPNPNSDLNFKGYDPNQEYSASASSAGTNKLGTNNNAATATGQKIMGTQQAAGASATAVSGSLGSGVGSSGSGVNGGSNSANSELAAYMPGGARDPAAAMNAAQVRAYNEARKQIRFPHSPSNFKAVQSAYDREKNRMGMNSLGVGN